MYWFTADEHYGHVRISEYTNRPFKTVEEMDEIIINNHNSVVDYDDITVHVGDFTLKNKMTAAYYINRLNGKHIFIQGSHDYWLKGSTNQIWERKIERQYVIACHYAMRIWPRSHWNSFLVYGHSHGQLLPEGKQWDVEVDNNNFFPVSFEQLKKIMADRPDNFNLIKGNRDEEKTG